MPSVALDSAVGDVARSSDSALDHSARLGDTAWTKKLGETARPSSPAEITPVEKTLRHEPAETQDTHDALSSAPPPYDPLSPAPPRYMPSRTEETMPVKAPEPAARESATREPTAQEHIAPIKNTAEGKPETQIGHEPTATRHAPEDEPHSAGTTDRPSDEMQAKAAEREIEEFRSVGESFTTAITDDTIIEILTIPDDTARPSTPSKESDTKQQEIAAIAKAAIAKEARDAMDRRHLDEDRTVS